MANWIGTKRDPTMYQVKRSNDSKMRKQKERQKLRTSNHQFITKIYGHYSGSKERDADPLQHPESISSFVSLLLLPFFIRYIYTYELSYTV